MKQATLIEIDDRNGTYPFLLKIKEKSMLEIFLNNIIKSDIYGEKIYISTVNSIVNKIQPIIEKYKNEVILLKINETRCNEYKTIVEKIFIHSRESLKETIKHCGDVSHLIYFSAASVIFDEKLTEYLISETEKNNYDLSIYNFKTADINLAPYIVSIKSLENLLNNNIINNIKYLYPIYYIMNELSNKYRVNCDINYPESFLSIPYDIPKRRYLVNMAHVLKTKHIEKNIDFSNTDLFQISRKEIEKWSSYPDRFAIEIGVDRSGKNKFNPKINSDRPDWISVSKIKSLTESLKEFPVDIHFDLVGSKDPLLNPEIKSILDILYDFKMMRKKDEVFSGSKTEITIYTDGSGLSDGIIDHILMKGVDNLLFNTYTGHSDDYQDQTGNSFETVKNNFINYLNKKYEYMKKNDIS